MWFDEKNKIARSLFLVRVCFLLPFYLTSIIESYVISSQVRQTWVNCDFGLNPEDKHFWTKVKIWISIFAGVAGRDNVVEVIATGIEVNFVAWRWGSFGASSPGAPDDRCSSWWPTLFFSFWESSWRLPVSLPRRHYFLSLPSTPTFCFNTSIQTNRK